jgi:hypothetical protein
MKDRVSPSDNEYHRWLASNADNKCFETAVPRMGALQDAARYQTMDRSYQAKYPGEAGVAVRALANEVLARLAAANAIPAPVAAPVPVSVPAPTPVPPLIAAAPVSPAAPAVISAPVVITPTPIAPPAPISTSSIDEALQQVQNAVRR